MGLLENNSFLFAIFPWQALAITAHNTFQTALMSTMKGKHGHLQKASHLLFTEHVIPTVYQIKQQKQETH